MTRELVARINNILHCSDFFIMIGHCFRIERRTTLLLDGTQGDIVKLLDRWTF